MSRRFRWPFFIVLPVITALFFYWSGTQRQLARSTVANMVALKFEEACLRTNDVECLRSSWTIRATAASKLARGLVEGPVPGPLDAELKSYVLWADALPISSK